MLSESRVQRRPKKRGMSSSLANWKSNSLRNLTAFMNYTALVYLSFSLGEVRSSYHEGCSGDKFRADCFI